MKTLIKTLPLIAIAVAGVAVLKKNKRYYLNFNEDGSVEHNLPSIIKNGKSTAALLK